MNVRELWTVVMLFILAASSSTMYIVFSTTGSNARFLVALKVNFTSETGNISNLIYAGNYTETKMGAKADKSTVKASKSEVIMNCSMKNIETYFLKAFLVLNSRLEELNGAIKTLEETIQANRSKTLTVGVLIATTTRKMTCSQLLKFSLFEKTLPSLIKTATKGYSFIVYLGFDQDDAYFLALRNTIKSEEQFKNIRLVYSGGNNFVAAVNALAKTAYEEEVDYFLRVNDDTEFASVNWAPTAIAVLEKYKPPNIGVVGPSTKGGKQSILTHDMVHRTHFEIFQYYYPPAFENWWADDWITLVYQPSRMTKLKTWTVKHLLTKTRYKVNRNKSQILRKEVSAGKIKLEAYSPIFRSEFKQ